MIFQFDIECLELLIISHYLHVSYPVKRRRKAKGAIYVAMSSMNFRSKLNVHIQGIVKSITHWSHNHNQYVRCQLGFALSSKFAKFTSSNIELSPWSSLCV
jgi:hypothetical protein